MEEIKKETKRTKKEVMKGVFRGNEETWLVALVGNQMDDHIRQGIPTDSLTVTRALWDAGYAADQINQKKVAGAQGYLSKKGYFIKVEPTTRITYMMPLEN